MHSTNSAFKFFRMSIFNPIGIPKGKSFYESFSDFFNIRLRLSVTSTVIILFPAEESLSKVLRSKPSIKDVMNIYSQEGRCKTISLLKHFKQPTKTKHFKRENRVPNRELSQSQGLGGGGGFLSHFWKNSGSA